MSDNFERAKKTADQVKSHLEFLGYAVEEKTESNGRPTLMCKHNSKLNMFAWFNKSGEHGFRGGYTKEKETNSIDHYKLLNAKNNALFLTKLYLDKDEEVQFVAVYNGDYDRTGFGTFIDTLLLEMNTVVDDEFKKLFCK